MHIDITNKVAVVTGAGQGIGASLARRFAAEGCKVAIWEREADTMDKVVAEIRKAGGTVEPIKVDVSVESEVAAALDMTVKKFKTVDILLNNAGVGYNHPVDGMKMSEWDDTFAVNTRAVMMCARAVIPTMKKQRSGRIINAASFASIIPAYGMSAYAASKAAVTSMTRVMAAELGPWHITVNCYAPGMIPTRLSGYHDVTPQRRKQLWDTLTFPRWGEPNEIADLAIFLASDQAAYITGTMVDVSGGKFAVQFPQMAHDAAKLD